MPILPFNWVDAISVAIVLFGLVEGWRFGFIHLLASFGAYSLAAIISLKYHSVVGTWGVTALGIPKNWTDPVGYIVIIFLTFIIFVQLFIFLSERFIHKILFTRLDKILGSIAGFWNAVVFLLLLFIVIAAIPDAVFLKEGIEGSAVAKNMLTVADRFGGNSMKALEKTISQNVHFLTIDPSSGEMVSLPVAIQEWNMVDDQYAANDLLILINTERNTKRIRAVSLDASLSKVALLHSRDMFERQYFSHTSPDGKTLANRISDAHISVVQAAENLAYAPNIVEAHKGLMDSTLHRMTILNAIFTKVGIGVVDSGGTGIMVTEIFAR